MPSQKSLLDPLSQIQIDKDQLTYIFFLFHTLRYLRAPIEYPLRSNYPNDQEELNGRKIFIRNSSLLTELRVLIYFRYLTSADLLFTQRFASLPYQKYKYDDSGSRIGPPYREQVIESEPDEKGYRQKYAYQCLL
jgi:hypothetical protein